MWKQCKTRMEAGDKTGALADAELTAALYSYFEQRVLAGTMNAKSLTGTLSILGQAYVMMNDSARAKIIFEQVVKASPSSPDANAGLARMAQADKDYREASDLWTRVESEAAESDDLWYEARYNLALDLCRRRQPQSRVRQAGRDPQRASKPGRSGNENPMGRIATQTVPERGSDRAVRRAEPAGGRAMKFSRVLRSTSKER